jgi:hypothetical protein
MEVREVLWLMLAMRLGSTISFSALSLCLICLLQTPSLGIFPTGRHILPALGHSHIQDEMMKRVITLLVWKGG